MFHTASPTRTSATGPYRCAVVRKTGGATDAPRYSKDSPSPRTPQRPLLRSLQMIADPAATPINPIGARIADQYGARVEVNEASGVATARGASLPDTLALQGPSLTGLSTKESTLAHSYIPLTQHLADQPPDAHWSMFHHFPRSVSTTSYRGTKGHSSTYGVSPQQVET